MKRSLIIGAASVLAGFALGTPAAMATNSTPDPSFTTCKNLSGWYANPDEQADLPAPTEKGLKFENKDLIHRSTSPIDLADMDKVTASFVATNAGKVVVKFETSSPYSSIIVNDDGKIWSTAMTYDQDGGQGHPIAKISGLIGLPTKPGKAAYTSASAVVTFGVGYWVTEGDTVVSSISFHGTKYPLTCKGALLPEKPVATASPSRNSDGHGMPPTSPATSKPTTSPATSKPTDPTPTATATTRVPTTSPTPEETGTTSPVAVSNVSDDSALPKTGPSMGLFIGGGALLLMIGSAIAFLARRRKVGFTA